MDANAPTVVDIPVFCAPKKAPCPYCGKKARRTRTHERPVRTIEYHKIVFLRENRPSATREDQRPMKRLRPPTDAKLRRTRGNASGVEREVSHILRNVPPASPWQMRG